ncbi:collagenase [Longispora albida]|uniref:collagenase n=1 Tax=Longispora albida TaxID=203523 RepID=UPI00037CFCA9|nr:collagenase [Longispora albida]
MSLVVASLAAGLLAAPALPATAAPAQASPAVGTPVVAPDRDPQHVGTSPLPMKDRAPLPASSDATRRDYDAAPPAQPQGLAAAACTVSDFTSKTGWALVAQIKASTLDCVNTLFKLTGSDANGAFREAQMTSVAYGLRDNGISYPGDNSTGTAQLVLYLRAGYFVHWYHPADVGTYGTALQTAIRSGLDSFFGNSRAFDVNDANGQTLAEAVTLIDSAEENARYIWVVKRMLTSYNSSYDAYWWMLAAVNNTYTVTFRGHQVPAFVSAVQADQSLLDTLHTFATSHLDMLGGDRGYLTANAGRELGRFLQHSAMHTKVRPLARDLLTKSAMTGPRAALWVGVAEMADYYDKANCAYFDTCNLQARLSAAVLPVSHTCASTLRIRAQQMTAGDLSSACTSMLNQDAYFHSVVADPGPVSGDVNTDLEVVVFDSSRDYQTYAGALFGINTNNGGMYLEGNPADPANQARFIAYEAEWARPSFEIWNLNHEYTHYLDGRFNMHGDFGANITTPTIWWVEGFAEYISYSYRNLTYTAAITEAGKGTYALSTLFDTTYDNADSTRIYRWGYLAVRYMLQSHRSDMTTVLGYYRAGNWNAARTYLKSTIGTRYDNDWRTWLAACAAGSCGGGTPSNQPPVSSFTFTTSGLTATFTDRSTDPDGSVTSRSWDFGDGTTSTAASPVKTYAGAGSYTVKLTVTDNKGATASSTQAVAVSSGGLPECTGPDLRTLDRNCQRSNRGTAAGNYDHFYIYLSAGVTTLRFTSSGGTGNCDLYYNANSWAYTNSYTSRSANAGNGETITVTNAQAGYRYLSLYGTTACSGVTVKAEY